MTDDDLKVELERLRNESSAPQKRGWLLRYCWVVRDAGVTGSPHRHAVRSTPGW